MLLQFSVKNFKLFEEKATLSFIASNYDTDTREEENVYFDEKYKLRLLKSAVVYGANASGKSKLFEALGFVRYFIINSSKEGQQGEKIPVDPFRLNVETAQSPSEFEVIFIYNNIQYRYGFEVTQEEVVGEWLFYKPKTKEVELFYRDKQDIEIHDKDFPKGKMLAKEGMVRENALLISTAAQFNEEKASEVIDWFKEFKILSGLNIETYEGFTVSQSNKSGLKEKILDLLKAADMGIQDIEVETLEDKDLPEDMPQEFRTQLIKEMKEGKTEVYSDVSTYHKMYDAQKRVEEQVVFSMKKDESAGTKKFFALTGPILDVLENGYTLVVDELDTRLHPKLVYEIVLLFNSKVFNPKNAQLVFNTHNTTLLGSKVYRRDQVWFTEKDRQGAAKLFSLADFKTDEVRKNDPFDKRYLLGKYGAVPHLRDFETLRQRPVGNEQ